MESSPLLLGNWYLDDMGIIIGFSSIIATLIAIIIPLFIQYNKQRNEIRKLDYEIDQTLFEARQLVTLNLPEDAIAKYDLIEQKISGGNDDLLKIDVYRGKGYCYFLLGQDEDFEKNTNRSIAAHQSALRLIINSEGDEYITAAITGV